MEGKFDTNRYIISANEIIPGLWIGNEAASQSREFIEKNKIGVIVNVTRHIPCAFNDIKYYRVQVNDPGPTNSVYQEDNMYMLQILNAITTVMAMHRGAGDNILVHCHAGFQRSAAVVMAYLACYWPACRRYTKRYERMRCAYALMCKSRPQVFHWGGFMSFGPAVSIYIARHIARRR